MPKLLVIPDIHGRVSMVQNIQPRNYNHVILLGDLLDSFDQPEYNQIQVLQRVIKLQKEFPNVHVLIGNHDYQYIVNRNLCAGWQENSRHKYHSLCKEIRLETTFQYDQYLFSHAGLSKTFLNTINQHYDEDEYNNVSEYINEFGLNDRLHNTIGNNNGYGDSVDAGINWIRPYSLYTDLYTDSLVKIQVVGHTPGEGVRILPGLILTDCGKPLELFV